MLKQTTYVRTYQHALHHLQCICVQAYSSVYTIEQELRQELQKREQAKQQKEDLEGRIHETELRIAKLTEKSQDSRQVPASEACDPVLPNIMLDSFIVCR